MTGTETVAPTEFEGKYLDGNSVGGFLVNGFFRAVGASAAGLSITSALEVGCGAGHSTSRLRHMLAADITFEASDVAADNVARAAVVAPDVPVTQESIYELPREDNSADLVFCLEVLEHLEDPAAALREVARVAKVAAIISVPREPIWRMLNMARGAYLGGWGNTPGHIQHWSKGRFGRFISTEFDVETVHTPLPWTVVLGRPRTKSAGR